MKALLAIVTVLLTSSVAFAADDDMGWYVGAGFGQSALRNACNYAATLGPSLTCDDESNGWKVLLGKKIYKYTALEFQYLDAGEAKITEPAATPSTLAINPRMYSLFLKFDVPVTAQGRLGVFLKAGMNYYDTEYARTGSFLALPKSDDGIDTAIGGGFSWRGWSRLSAILEWENFNDPVVGNGDVTFTSIGVLFHF